MSEFHLEDLDDYDFNAPNEVDLDDLGTTKRPGERPTASELAESAEHFLSLKAKHGTSEYYRVLKEVLSVATNTHDIDEDIFKGYGGWTLADFQELFQQLGLGTDIENLKKTLGYLDTSDAEKHSLEALEGMADNRDGLLELGQVWELNEKVGEKLDLLLNRDLRDLDDGERYDLEMEVMQAVSAYLDTMVDFVRRSNDALLVGEVLLTLTPILEHSAILFVEYPDWMPNQLDKIATMSEKIESLVTEYNQLDDAAPLSLMVKYGTPTQRREALQFFERNIHLLDASIAHGPPNSPVIRSIKVLIEHGSSRDIPNTYSALVNLLDKEEDSEIRGSSSLFAALVLSKDSEHLNEDITFRLKIILGHKLKKLGLDYHSILGVWFKYDKTASREVGDNLENLLKLEKHKPGLAKRLNTEYGIVHFGRYPVDLLIDMDTHKQDTTLPYGIIVYPIDDWNSGFLSHSKIFAKLRGQLQGKYNMRVVECRDKKDITRKLLNFDYSYGDSQKISFAIIGGHGGKGRIQFGSPGDHKSYLTTENLTATRVRKGRELFKPNPNLILVSCSTGENQGIAENLSHKFKARVFAPDTPTNIKDINAKMDGENIDFQVSYGDQGTLRTYNAGIKE